MKTKVLVAYGYPNPPGGGNAVFSWTLQALQDDFDVTLLTWHPMDVDEVNGYYGTAIRRDGVKVRLYRLPWVARHVHKDFLLMVKHCAMTPVCRAIGSEFDVLLCPGEEIDFGRPGIQYIHFPRCHDWRFNRRIRKPDNISEKPWYHRHPFLIDAYVRLCKWRFGVTAAGMRMNLTLANSDWTCERVREALDMPSVTVYPPVPQDFADVPWEKREDGFVCIGRLSAEKRVEFMIDVVAGLRARGWPVHIHVVGTRGARDYLRRIEALREQNPDWVFLELDRSHEDLARCVTAHRYGIHAMHNEHFGIAVAELVQGGTVVFVPNSGGQIEIVGRRPELIYNDCAEAVSRIEAVLADQNLRDSLRAHLRVQAGKFTATVFMDRVRTIVAEAARWEKVDQSCSRSGTPEQRRRVPP